ncbi:alpha/beta hydrolase [Bacillus pseudomycoides]|uniref:Alpha/beta hydrolase n=1 Tax=Bacillus pseudomycoides TaxID=64104 RepID=A0AA91VAP9_9BACI|nr:MULTISPECIES: alpha/beta hydrolase [Bacillus]PEB53033.1 alpha/beta hydrolase [Bacillus sp. AFS098217]PED81781.1 alpha/beta hydrolase [Bacillus pseudomycoides]PEU15209.1 alpha/beta hydrolase [Bacillus sp. AFS014408]PEU17811.1 alpha/beta hydrolase [Bacillus sp. AFS019443]PFW63082.1 alpha/beta hydrolase [Bacillus sp. AFS075034]
MIQPATMEFVSLSNGETIAYQEVGRQNKEILVLIHGNMTSSQHWDLVIEKLQGEYHIYAIDLRGFGKSTYHKPIDSLQDFADDVKLFIDELQLKKFSLMGWSMGGGVAMEFTACHTEFVEKLILVESVGMKGYPIFKKDMNGQPIVSTLLKTKEEIAQDPVQIAPVLDAIKNMNKLYYQTVWNLLIYTHHKPDPERYEKYLDDMLTQRNFVDVNYALTTFNISDEHNGVVLGNGHIHRLQVPTLVVQGDRDYVVPQVVGEELANHLPNAKLAILEDCGHSPFIDCLDEFTQHVTNWLENK